MYSQKNPTYPQKGTRTLYIEIDTLCSIFAKETTYHAFCGYIHIALYIALQCSNISRMLHVVLFCGDRALVHYV